MISYFNIPSDALIDVPITKKQFAEKVNLSVVEKRVLREDVERITMRGLLQTRTVGIASYNDSDYNYDQIVFAEVCIRNQSKTAIIVSMIQKAFPAPMILIVNYQDTYCLNGCIKRVNQSDNSKRVIEDEQTTRYFTLNSDEVHVNDWLHSLDIQEITCSTLKELFEAISAKLLMLKVSDEAGVFIQADVHNIVNYRRILEQLKENREEQRYIIAEINEETQFNRTIKLNSRLRELQDKERDWQKQLKQKGDVI